MPEESVLAHLDREFLEELYMAALNTITELERKNAQSYCEGWGRGYRDGQVTQAEYAAQAEAANAASTEYLKL